MLSALGLGTVAARLTLVLNMMQSIMGYYHTARSVWSNKLVQLSFVLIIIYMVYRWFF